MIVPSRLHARSRRAPSDEPGWRYFALGTSAFLVLAAACFYLLALAGR